MPREQLAFLFWPDRPDATARRNLSRLLSAARTELGEEVHRRLIALYGATGDRAAAAEQFDRCALILERELGVSPLPETRTTYEVAMAAREVPAPVKADWSVLPSLDLPLTGRELAWETLAEAHARLQAGGLILISGERGVGKSRLMKAFATTQDALVLAGNNPPAAQGSAYTPIGEALRQALSHRQRRQAIRPIWLAEVGRLLPEIASLFSNLPAAIEVEATQAQARIHEALRRCLQRLAATGPLLLCLDDLHWSDQATLGWLASLPGRLAGSGVSVLATYRSARRVLADVKEAFSRPGLLAEIPLFRLSVGAVEAMLAQVPQHPPDLAALAYRIHRATDGNTFFVLETVRVLLAGGWMADPPEQLPLAPTVEAAIGRRLEQLSPLARQMAETAAVLAPDLRVALLEETAGRSALEVAEGLDELIGRQLLVEGRNRRFGHELLREVTYKEISPWRRRILHRRAAAALEGAGQCVPLPLPDVESLGDLINSSSQFRFRRFQPLLHVLPVAWVGRSQLLDPASECRELWFNPLLYRLLHRALKLPRLVNLPLQPLDPLFPLIQPCVRVLQVSIPGRFTLPCHKKPPCFLATTSIVSQVCSAYFPAFVNG